MNESGSIGCKVEVVRHKPEEDGHAWIGVRGVERFRIHEEVPGMPYYRAYTETFSDQGPAASPQRRNRTFSLFQEVVEHLGGEEVDEETILGEPDLSFALARTLKIQPSWIEAFLELREEDQRLSELDTVFKAVLLRETEEGDS